MSEEREYISVSEVNSRVKALLENSSSLSSLYVKAEVSNFKIYPSGHAYFSLKDESSLISCIMWASYARNLRFAPNNGDKVLVHGKITTYHPKGTYQLTVTSMEKDGEGDERRKLRELALKLKAEGLFDESRKRPLPPFPKRIAVIAGSGSAGLRDIEVNLAKRWPLSEVSVFPSLVQGKEAPADLIRSLSLALLAKPDVLIIGRGGGSSEDLGAFNDEGLVRALASFPVPFVSAVGHEIDVTLTDLVADKRVSTPTAAAVAVVKDQYEVMQHIDVLASSLDENVSSLLSFLRSRLDSFLKKPYFKNGKGLYEHQKETIDALSKNLQINVTSLLETYNLKTQSLSERLTGAIPFAFLLRKEKVDGLKKRLDSANPEKVMARGYSITTLRNGKSLRSKAQLQIGQEIETRLKDGIIVSRVTSKEEKGDER